MAQKINLKAAVAAGIAAGLVSGLVKLGWENLMPPRTPERDATNPPQNWNNLESLVKLPTRPTRTLVTSCHGLVIWSILAFQLVLGPCTASEASWRRGLRPATACHLA